MRRRHRRADGLDGQLDAGHAAQRLERRGDAGGGGRAQGGGDGAGDGGDRVGGEPVARLQPLRDQVGRVVAVVRQQVGLVVLSGHRQLRLQDKVDLEATFRMVIFPLSKIDIGCYKISSPEAALD